MNKKLKIKNNASSLLPSEWVKNNLSISNSELNLLDLACGNGRHSIYAASIGYKVTSIDINKNVLLEIQNKEFIIPIQLDLEKNNIWPLKNKKFDVVIITNYLYRPIFKNIIKSMKPNGKLIYETFTEENSAFGKPNNKNYLLRPQELLNFSRNNKLEIINYEEIIIEKPTKKAVQRIFSILK
jgi:2-polyprenyl-3-methyl-5-hydroxy-6-metoxy-1,4-benzoquinol methylase